MTRWVLAFAVAVICSAGRRKIGKEYQLVADQAAIDDCSLTGAVLQGNLAPALARQLITAANQLMLQRKKPLTGLINP
ncbi:hypothetical protein [Bradyrhizobium liaoningense]